MVQPLGIHFEKSKEGNDVIAEIMGKANTSEKKTVILDKVVQKEPNTVNAADQETLVEGNTSHENTESSSITKKAETSTAPKETDISTREVKVSTISEETDDLTEEPICFCHARIDLRTIHQFPAYSYVSAQLPAILDPNVNGIFTGKTRGKDVKTRAQITEKLKQAIIDGQVTGEPAFWVKIPIPEAHKNHELGSFDDKWDESDCEILKQIKKLAEISICGIT